MLKQIQNANPGQVKVVFKHYPLPMHANAKPAALASYAAQKQSRFWEMHDLLYQNQRALDPASLRRYAESLGLDMAAYDRDVAAAESVRYMDQQLLEAQRLGVPGTPSFYVNGVLAPMWDAPTLQRFVDLAKSGGDVAMEAGRMIAEQQARQAALRAAQAAAMDPNRVFDIDTTGSPSRGPANAPVTIVEFSDYQ